MKLIRVRYMRLVSWLAALLSVAMLVSGQTREDRGVRMTSKDLPSALIGTNHALIVGIDDYRHLADLSCAVADAKGLAKVLRDNYGFSNIKELYNSEATREAIVQTLYGYAETFTEKDNLLIYYAGHGDENEVLKKGYLIPHDAHEARLATYIANSTIKDLLSGIRAKHVLLISDSCFSGTLLRTAQTEAPPQKLTAWYERAMRKTSREVLTSGDLEKVPDGLIQGHSAFAYHLIKMLTETDNEVFSTSDIYTEIRNRVGTDSPTGQMVRHGEIPQTGHTGGEFVFCKAPSGVRLDSQIVSPAAIAKRTGNEPEIYELALVYTAETHAMIEPCNCPLESLGGVARRAYRIGRLREKYTGLLVLDGGGAFAGGIYDEYVQGEALDRERSIITMKAMAKMGYDAVCLGDEEFTFGRDTLKWVEKELGLCLVSCNIQAGDGSPFVSPFVIRKVGNLNVLVTGVCTLEAPTGDNWEQLEGLSVTDPAKAVSTLLAEHKNEADVVVVLAHLGEEASKELAAEVDGIDLVFNSNRRTSTKRSYAVDGTHLVNFDYQGQNLILARLKPRARNASDRLIVEDIPLGKDTPDDPGVASLVSEFAKLTDTGQVKPTVRIDLYMGPNSESAFETVSGLAEASQGAIDLNVYYIIRTGDEGSFTALRGDEETQETLRRICISRTQPEKLMPYVACRGNAIARTDWADCAEKVGIDVSSLMRCLASDYPKNELLAATARCERLRIDAFPAVFINNRRFRETPERRHLLSAICSALRSVGEEAEFCSSLRDQ